MIEFQGKFYGRHWKRKGFVLSIKDMYDGATIIVRTQGKVIEDFSTKISLY